MTTRIRKEQITSGNATDGYVLTADGAGGVAWETAGSGTASVATDSIWDAKGDLAVGTASNAAAVLTVGTDGYVLTADSTAATGLKWAASGGTASGIPESIIDAKGDLIVGTAANTAAILAVGTNDYVLTADSSAALGIKWAETSSGGISSGTAFPGAPSTNDLFHRTDLDGIYTYDGARWLSIDEREIAWTARTAVGTGLSATSTVAHASVPSTGLYLTTLEVACWVNTTSSGTQYWTVEVQSHIADNTSTAIGSVSTVSNAADSWVRETSALNAVVDGSTAIVLYLVATKVSTPGTFIFGATLRFRAIAT